jgi:hypothetical protein
VSVGRYVDLIIPRGSNDFVQYVMRNTDIPVPPFFAYAVFCIDLWAGRAVYAQ